MSGPVLRQLSQPDHGLKSTRAELAAIVEGEMISLSTLEFIFRLQNNFPGYEVSRRDSAGGLLRPKDIEYLSKLTHIERSERRCIGRL